MSDFRRDFGCLPLLQVLNRRQRLQIGHCSLTKPGEQPDRLATPGPHQRDCPGDFRRQVGRESTLADRSVYGVYHPSHADGKYVADNGKVPCATKDRHQLGDTSIPDHPTNQGEGQ